MVNSLVSNVALVQYLFQNQILAVTDLINFSNSKELNYSVRNRRFDTRRHLVVFSSFRSLVMFDYYVSRVYARTVTVRKFS